MNRFNCDKCSKFPKEGKELRFIDIADYALFICDNCLISYLTDILYDNKITYSYNCPNKDTDTIKSIKLVIEYE